MTKYISYLRVSTDKQSKSGIGLEGQRRHIEQATKDGELIQEYCESISGFSVHRPQFEQAVKHCKDVGATLIVSDLDRLSRDCGFLMSELPKLGIEWKAANMVGAEDYGISFQLAAIMSQEEGRKIQKRAKVAAQTRRLRGDVMGNAKNFTQTTLNKSKETRELQAKSNRNTMLAVGVIRLMEGKKNTEIAAYLNKYGFKTRNNSSFTHVQVGRIKEMFNLK